MNLLDLPPELLQPIFDFSPITSCLQAAYSCKTLFNVLSTYRKGLLHQLSQIPSYPTPTDNDSTLSSKSTSELFLLLRRRAAAQLYGANFNADQCVYTFGSSSSNNGQDGITAPVIDTLASAIRSTGTPNAALVQKGSPRVFLYSISDGQVVPSQVLEPVVEWPGTVEILKVVFSADGMMVSVLQKFRPAEDATMSTAMGDVGNGSRNRGSNHPFVEEAMKPYRRESTQLVHYRRATPFSPRYSRVTISAFPGQDDYHPLAVAVAHRYLAAISWQHKRHLDRRMIVVHAAHPDPATEDMKIAYQVYNDCTIITQDGNTPYSDRHQRPRPPSPPEPIIQMTFNDNATQLLYYHPSSTIYGHFQRLGPLEYGSISTTSVLFHNRAFVNYYHHNHPDAPPANPLRFTIAIPFFSTHATITDPSTNTAQNQNQPAVIRQVCVWTYLSLGTAHDAITGELVACLLRATARCRTSSCGHVQNLDRGRRLEEWSVVARLAGYSTSVNTLPGIVATSPRATRLAIANWKTITVWAVEPGVIIGGGEGDGDGGYGGVGDADTDADADADADGDGDGDGDGNARVYPANMVDEGVTGEVLLEPVVLESEAVCFGLAFAGEDEIVALTDRGVVRWGIGAGAVGRRGRGVLGVVEGVEWEEWEEMGEDDGEEMGRIGAGDPGKGLAYGVRDEHEDEGEDERVLNRGMAMDEDEDEDDEDDEESGLDEDEDEDMGIYNMSE
ncbi:hypothetical protein AJ79_08182 [Helicocarpus griseus UAMH5409]|uniref:F-box domain-containing protein n=1 Tax=Helicocarpus griseus UAMH5409 TaxID=1447875 RepID=A0A2B7WVG4_9EURO|nr:hypothetical protein AJ79_08182 [Helicocarpus griseus UAMH5409]